MNFANKNEDIFSKEQCEENCVFAEVYFLTKNIDQRIWLFLIQNAHFCSSQIFHITRIKRGTNFSRKNGYRSRGTCRLMHQPGL
jgi:hypothetical protein